MVMTEFEKLSWCLNNKIQESFIKEKVVRCSKVILYKVLELNIEFISMKIDMMMQ